MDFNQKDYQKGQGDKDQQQGKSHIQIQQERKRQVSCDNKIQEQVLQISHQEGKNHYKVGASAPANLFFKLK